VLSSISFRPKPYDLVPCLNLLKVILPVPEVILPSLSGQIFKSRERYLEDICWMRVYGFAGWIRARNSGWGTSEVRKSTIPLGIVL
jgi:hypothetical protein